MFDGVCREQAGLQKYRHSSRPALAASGLPPLKVVPCNPGLLHVKICAALNTLKTNDATAAQLLNNVIIPMGLPATQGVVTASTKNHSLTPRRGIHGMAFAIAVGAFTDARTR